MSITANIKYHLESSVDKPLVEVPAAGAGAGPLKLKSVYCCRTKHENEPGRFAKLLLRLPGKYDDMNRLLILVLL